MAATALVIGAGIQAYGSYQSGQDKAFAYRMEAAGKRAQASQVEIAANREVSLAERKYERVRGAQMSAWGRSGVQVSTGSPLLAMEETAANAFDEIRSIRDAARYRKTTLLTEGVLDDYNADSSESAGMLGALGAGFGAFSKNPYSYDQPFKSGQAGGDSASKFGGIA